MAINDRLKCPQCGNAHFINHIVNYSKGFNSKGFTVCLNCGKKYNIKKSTVNKVLNAYSRRRDMMGMG